MARVHITVSKIDGFEHSSCRCDVDIDRPIKEQLRNAVEWGQFRCFFRGLLIGENTMASHLDLTTGCVVLVIREYENSGTRKNSQISDLEVSSEVTVLITDHYREQCIFLVADDSAYGVPVCFLGDNVDKFTSGNIISATIVGAKIDYRRWRVEYVILDGAVREPCAQICALSKPVCLVMRRSSQVGASISYWKEYS
jgi:hypothetical protein